MVCEDEVDLNDLSTWYETTQLGRFDFDRTSTTIAAPVLMALLAMSIIPCLMPPLFYTLGLLGRRLLADSAVTVSDMRALYAGPPFYFAFRLGAACAFFVLVLIFGPGMPLVYAVGAFYFLINYWAQKWGMLRVNRLPDLAFDHHVMLRGCKWAKYMLFVRGVGLLDDARLPACRSPRSSASAKWTRRCATRPSGRLRHAAQLAPRGQRHRARRGRRRLRRLVGAGSWARCCCCGCCCWRS